jgi:hypothetical protein
VAALTAIGLGEFYFVAQKTGARPYDLLGRLGAFLLLASAYLPHGQGVLWLAVVVLAAGSLIAPLLRRSENATLDIGATLLGTLYVGGLFAYLLLLRGLARPGRHHLSAAAVSRHLGDGRRRLFRRPDLGPAQARPATKPP